MLTGGEWGNLRDKRREKGMREERRVYRGSYRVHTGREVLGCPAKAFFSTAVSNKSVLKCRGLQRSLHQLIEVLILQFS